MQNLKDARYDSVADFVASLDGFRNPSEGNRRIEANYHDGKHWNNNWFGADCKVLSDVKVLMRDGWADGQKAVNNLLSQLGSIDATPADRRRRLSRGDTGDTLDIGAVYRGRLDVAWSRAVRRPSYAPQKIDLLVDVTVSGATDSSVIQWRGVAAVALADKLEAAGYMVRIVVGFGGTDTGDKREDMSCRITVKDYDKPLDISTAATVTLPGFFRALGHTWVVRHAQGTVSTAISTVGQCHEDADETVISRANVNDRASALRFLHTQIEAMNARAAA